MEADLQFERLSGDEMVSSKIEVSPCFEGLSFQDLSKKLVLNGRVLEQVFYPPKDKFYRGPGFYNSPDCEGPICYPPFIKDEAFGPDTKWLNQLAEFALHFSRNGKDKNDKLGLTSVRILDSYEAKEKGEYFTYVIIRFTTDLTEKIKTFKFNKCVEILAKVQGGNVLQYAPYFELIGSTNSPSFIMKKNVLYLKPSTKSKLIRNVEEMLSFSLEESIKKARATLDDRNIATILVLRGEEARVRKMTTYPKCYTVESEVKGGKFPLKMEANSSLLTRVDEEGNVIFSTMLNDTKGVIFQLSNEKVVHIDEDVTLYDSTLKMEEKISPESFLLNDKNEKEILAINEKRRVKILSPNHYLFTCGVTKNLDGKEKKSVEYVLLSVKNGEIY